MLSPEGRNSFFMLYGRSQAHNSGRYTLREWFLADTDLRLFLKRREIGALDTSQVCRGLIIGKSN